MGCIASGVYLLGPSDKRDAWARAGAECAVVFGGMMLVSGPLWAKKAWGVYWTWDPRLTTTLLSVLLYTAVVVLRTFAGEGDAERRFAAALTVLGTFNLPIIHYSVMKWGGNHPIVIGKGGGGLRTRDMSHALTVGFVAMSLLALVLVWSRARLAYSRSRIARLEELAAAAGLVEMNGQGLPCPRTLKESDEPRQHAEHDDFPRRSLRSVRSRPGRRRRNERWNAAGGCLSADVGTLARARAAHLAATR